MNLRSVILCLAATSLLGVTSFASSFRSAVSSAPNANGHSTFYRLPPIPKDTVLYDNGPDDGLNAWNITNGFTVSDSFTLGANSTLNSVTFSNWFFPGDTGLSVDWAITSTPLGSALFSRTASLTGTMVGQGLGFFDIYSEMFSLGGLNLAAGTYYLQMNNEVISVNGDPGFWGESGGPSAACQDGNGFTCATNPIPSESFQISGTNGPPPIPEPSSILLFGTGLLGAAGALRRKFSL